MDRQSSTISKLAGVDVDLVYLAPMADRTPAALRQPATRVHNDYTERSAPQRRYYVSAMREDEALLLKCYDSARDGRAVLSPHGAFEDPTAPADVLPRESIELRMIAFHAA